MRFFKVLVNKIKQVFNKKNLNEQNLENNNSCFRCITKLISKLDTAKISLNKDTYIIVEDNLGIAFLLEQKIKAVVPDADIRIFNNQDMVTDFLKFINSIDENSVDKIKLIILDITLKSVFKTDDQICNLNGICLATWLQKQRFKDKWIIFTGNDIHSNSRIYSDIINLYNKVTSENLFESEKILFKFNGFDNIIKLITKGKG